MKTFNRAAGETPVALAAPSKEWEGSMIRARCIAFRQMLATTLLSAATCFTLGCQHERQPKASGGPATNPTTSANLADALPALTGRPSWLPIGPDIYHEHDVEAAEQSVLQLRREPRWFIGFGRGVSPQEFKAYIETQRKIGSLGALTEPPNLQGGQPAIPDPPPFPESVDALPLEDQGVRLALDVQPTADPTILLLTLELSTQSMLVERQMEHRWTNALPFLFAFFVDGKAVSAESQGISKAGGSQSMRRLVEPGKSHRWSIKVDEKGVGGLLSNRHPHILATVAAFSNSQHLGHIEGSKLMALIDAIVVDGRRPTPVLVRSNPAYLKWTGTSWEATRQSAE